MAKKVAALLAENMRATRSALYLWLYENYDEIAPGLRLRRSWQAVARTAKAAGIEGPDNGGPSRQAVRKAWARVELDRAAAAAAPSSPPRAVIPPPQRQPDERRDKPDGPRFTFSPAPDESRLIGDTKSRKK